jgi:glycosyltransferase involved in cell wall biosynthesis
MENPISLKPLCGAPLVSVIVPSFNQGAFIRQTIASCLDQSYRPLEIVVIDGASTDDTVRVLESFGDRPELRWWSEPDEGVVDAVNKGFKRARGEILAIQSSDDFYLPGAVGLAARRFLEQPDLGLFFGNVRTVSMDGAPLADSAWPPFSLARFLAKETVILQPAAFFRREVVEACGGWNRDFFIADTEFWLRAVFRTRVANAEEVMAARRLHPDQRNTHWRRIVADYHRMTLTSPDLRRASRHLRRAARCGRYLNAARYTPLSCRVARWWAYVQAAVSMPSVLWRRGLFRAVVPGYGLLRRGAARWKRLAGGRVRS